MDATPSRMRPFVRDLDLVVSNVIMNSPEVCFSWKLGTSAVRLIAVSPFRLAHQIAKVPAAKEQDLYLKP